MADKDTETSAVRNGIVSLARDQVGEHYLLGAAGATPGREDGAWYRTGGVKLHPTSASVDSKAKDGRKFPIVLAATYSGSVLRVCAGRCSREEVKSRPKGDPGNPGHLALPSLYKWERPDRAMDASASVFGESCVGKRHFDCIHFVNWVLGNVQQRHYCIKHWIKGTKDVGFSDVWAGDVLTTGTHHIGIASGPETAIHASDTQWGVVESKIKSGEWDRCGRLDAGFWRRYKITPAEIIFDESEVDSFGGN